MLSDGLRPFNGCASATRGKNSAAPPTPAARKSLLRKAQTLSVPIQLRMGSLRFGVTRGGARQFASIANKSLRVIDRLARPISADATHHHRRRRRNVAYESPSADLGFERRVAT